MFDRYVRLAQARRALRELRLDEALALASDPLIASHRRAEDLRREACKRLLVRARERVSAGAVQLAGKDLRRVLQVFPDHPEATAVLASLSEPKTSSAPESDSAMAAARTALDRGELAPARRLLADADDSSPVVERRRLEAALAAVTTRAEHALGSARAAAAGERWRLAAAELCAAHGLAGDDPKVTAAISNFVRDHTRDLVAELEGTRGSGESADLARECDRFAAGLAGLAAATSFQRLRQSASVPMEGAVRAALLLGDPIAARRALGNRASGEANEGMATLVGWLESAVRAEDDGADVQAAEFFERLHAAIPKAAFASRAEAIRARAKSVDDGLIEVRSLAAAGSIHEARLRLGELSVKYPGHRMLLAEGRLLDDGALDRARQLEAARRAGAAGDLREANRLALALAVPGSNGEEPRSLLAEIRQRMDAVQAGLNQVLARLHERACSSPDGIRQCLARLEQLALLQRDHEELTRVRACLAAELAALAALDAADAALLGLEIDGLRKSLDAYWSARPNLLTPDRLDARALRTGEGILAEAERRRARGETARARVLVDTTAQLASAVVGLQREHASLAAKLDAANSAALELVERGRTALAARDLDGAEQALRDAVALSSDDPAVARFAEELAARSRADEAVSAARAHGDRRDFSAAHREIEQLGPTAPLMRTKIFDLKRELAKAQGLGTAFLLRVDEGGEFLVVRGESLTIGNLRDKTADLPMLANLAGRHARIVRTMSFHGGQADKLLAEGGEVFARGERVRELRLTGRVRFRLGPTVEMEYRAPGARSLSASITILGGFVVAGTDRVLWMKDRGRDGRILIGASPDAHVVVAGAEGEIELFADRDGRILIRAPQGATMDGKPIAGDHPLTAGAEVRAGKLSFVALPWQRP